VLKSTYCFDRGFKLIVDMHVHIPFSGLEYVEVEWREKFKNMLIVAQKAGIDKQVILGLSSNNEFVRELVDKHRDKLIGFVRGCCTDPKAPLIIEKFVKEYGFRGVKIHAEPNWSLSGLLSAHTIFLKAAEFDIPVVIHSWHDEEGLMHEARTLIISEGFSFPVRIIAELGRRYPNTKFVFVHMGGMWAKALDAARPYPNIYFDKSGFDPERGIIESAVEMIGASRILFGSDAPGRSYISQLAKVKYADISEGDKRKILGENALKLLKEVS